MRWGTTIEGFYSHFEKRSGTDTLYYYDGDGVIRRKKSSSPNADDYYYYGATGLHGVDHNGSYRSFARLGGQLLGSSDGFFILQDGRGDVVALVSNGVASVPTGAIVGAYTYDAYGEARSIDEIDDIVSPFRFAGGLFDGSTGKYVFGARTYDPGQGRWMTKDAYQGSVGDPLSLNRYAYCSNDPLNSVDPSGFISIDALMRANVRWAENHRSLTGKLQWIGLVMPHGKWDFKNVDGFKGKSFNWNGMPISAEQLGNINFGLTGAAIGFDEEELVWGSAFANAMWGKQQSPWDSVAKGDSFVDIFNVVLGYYYYGVIQGKYDFETAVGYALNYMAAGDSSTGPQTSQAPSSSGSPQAI